MTALACPACGAPRAVDGAECPACHVIYEKWSARRKEGLRPGGSAASPAYVVLPGSPKRFLLTASTLLVTVGVVALHREAPNRWVKTEVDAANLVQTVRSLGTTAAPAQSLSDLPRALGLDGGARILFQAVEAQMRAYLKEYLVGEEIYYADHEGARLAAFRELHGPGTSARYVSDSLYNAWDGGPKPVPTNGYLLAEVEEDETGAPLDHRHRAGLCAYPVKPQTGRAVVLMLVDVRKMGGRADTAGGETAVDDGGDYWNFYLADSVRLDGPVRRWPTEADLSARYTKLRKYTPGEGLAASKAIYEKYKKENPDAGLAERERTLREKVQPDLDRTALKAKLHKIRSALYLYHDQTERVPSEAEGLKPLTDPKTPYLDPADIVDPWGRPFLYRSETKKEGIARKVTVYVHSAGPDGTSGTGDDVYPD